MPDQNESVELSKREQEVLELVVTGASNKEIAQQLVISVNTVKVHVRNIFEKLGVQSRTELTRLAIQEKWVAIAESTPDDAAQAEAAPSTARTFLLSDNPPLALPRWQQFYLLGALLLAALVAVIPLLPRQAPRVAPQLPVIYAQAVTPTPEPAPNGQSSSRWKSHTAMPTGRAGLALAALQRNIYAIGGVRENNSATRSVEIFDTLNQSWAEGASKPTAATNIAGAVIDGKIYVPGGCTNDGSALDVLEIYDPAADTWSEGDPLPAPRCGYGLVAANNTLYLFGGWNGETFADTIFAHTPGQKGWEELPQTLPQPLGFMGAATLKDTIYLAGGYNGSQEFNQTYAFTPATGQLQEKAPLLENRGGLALVSGGNHLFAVGGGWDHNSDSSERYDPATDTWTAVETPFSGRWRNLGLTAVDTSLYAVGGWNGIEETFMDSVVSYQFIYQLFLPISSGDESKESQ
ncbi:MAG: kelch repeat-containing protein [Anaerolineae bacterium]